MAHRNKWFSELKNGGSFHGYVSHNQMVCTIYINLPWNLLLSHWDYGELSQMIMAMLTQLLQLGKAKRSAGTINFRRDFTQGDCCAENLEISKMMCVWSKTTEKASFFSAPRVQPHTIWRNLWLGSTIPRNLFWRSTLDANKLDLSRKSSFASSQQNCASR